MKQTRLYYGWYITVTLALTETVSWGVIFYAFSVLIAPMEADLGWTRTQITGAFSVALLVSAAAAYPVGAWVDRHGARALMTVGSIGASALTLAWARVDGLVAFYAIWAGLGVCFAAVLYDPAFAVVATWFRVRRGRALAIITFAAGLASTIFLPLTDVLERAYGWRGAVTILAVLMAVITIPAHLLVLRRRPADMGLEPDGEPLARGVEPQPTTGATLAEAAGSRVYWGLVGAFSLAYLAAAAIRVHFIPYLLERGVASGIAATASGSIGFMQVAGRVVFAPLEERLSARALLGGVFGMQLIAFTLLLAGPALVWVGLFIVVFGTSYGARTLVRPAVLADWYGAAHFGRISSVMMIFLTLAATIAPDRKSVV